MNMALLYCPHCDADTTCNGQDFSKEACHSCGYKEPADPAPVEGGMTLREMRDLLTEQIEGELSHMADPLLSLRLIGSKG